MIVGQSGQMVCALVLFAALGQECRCSRSGDQLPPEAVAGTVTLAGQRLLAAEMMKGGGNEQLTFALESK
jgi:hypothetical protein